MALPHAPSQTPPPAPVETVLVSPNGHKSFVVRFRFGGRPKKYTIGAVTIGLKAARSEAAKVILAVAQGNDPTATKRQAKEKQRLDALRVADTFYSVAEDFLAIEASKLRSVDERRSWVRGRSPTSAVQRSRSSST